MKRRKFLNLSAAGVGLMGLGPAGAAGNIGLYGEPMFQQSSSNALAENRLRLTLSRAELPVEAWEPIMNMSRLWGQVLKNKATRTAFQRSPRRFLRSRGVPDDIVGENSDQFRLLKMICDPYVRHLASSGNYRAFIGKLRDANVLEQRAGNRLRGRIRGLLQQDLQQLRSRMQSVTRDDFTQLSEIETTAELYAVSQQLAAANDTTQVVAAAVALVVVAVAVLTYVTISINAAVILNVAAAVAVVVAAAVTVSGGCTDCHANFGKLASLEPSMQQNLDTVIRAARLSGQASFETEALKDYIADESQACLEAAEDLAVIHLPRQKKVRQDLFRNVAQLSWKAAGLS